MNPLVNKIGMGIMGYKDAQGNITPAGLAQISSNTTNIRP